MAVSEAKPDCIFQTESAWCDGSIKLLNLPTGTWRTLRPVLKLEKCTYCGLCYLYCPPQCIGVAVDYFPIDLTYCKGCGICARECPTDAIEMIPEGTADGRA